MTTARFQVDLVVSYDSGKYTNVFYQMHGYPIVVPQGEHVVHSGI